MHCVCLFSGRDQFKAQLWACVCLCVLCICDWGCLIISLKQQLLQSSWMEEASLWWLPSGIPQLLLLFLLYLGRVLCVGTWLLLCWSTFCISCNALAPTWWEEYVWMGFVWSQKPISNRTWRNLVSMGQCELGTDVRARSHILLSLLASQTLGPPSSLETSLQQAFYKVQLEVNNKK